MTQFARILSLIAATLLTLPIAVPALASNHKSNADLMEISRMQLLPGWMRDDGWYMAAIQIDMAPGWKTYWREPGSGGIAPEFDWSGSRNLAQISYFWPAPQLYEAYGTRTIGYKNRLVLPVLLKPRNPGQAIDAQLTVDYGVCDDICVPVRSSGGQLLAAGPVANQDMIGHSVALRPRSGRAAGLTAATCTLERSGNDVVITARLAFASAVADVQMAIVETGSPTMWASDADYRRDGSAIIVQADLGSLSDGPITLDRGRLRFTLIGANDAIDIQGCAG